MYDTVEVPVPEAVCGYCRIRLTAIPAQPVLWAGLWHHPVCVEPAQIKAALRTDRIPAC